ncbi:hypothetical protein GW915_11985 [bacterium]|nr:hypothetical protein [bacterium]
MVMLQRNAKEILSYSLFLGMVVSFSVNAQSNINQDTSAESAVPTSLLESKPVEVSASLAPSQVPVNVTRTVQASTTETASLVNGLSLDDEEEESLAKVSSNQNKNGSGIQIFNLNSNDQDQKNKQEQEAKSESRADVLRRERIRQELANESRLIEKIEEDRISTENTRANSIEGLAFAETSAVITAGNDIEVVEVNTGAAQATPLMAAPAPMMAQTGSENVFSSTEFMISPMAGYRWTPNDRSEFKSQNVAVGGVALEGRVGNFLGLEANYIYGRDNLKQRIAVGPYGYNNFSTTGAGFFQNIRTRDTHEFNANAKLGWFVGKIRPYAIAGIGGMFTSYNIDDPYTKASAKAIGWQRNSTNMAANYGGGVDLKVNRNLSVGTRIEYQYIFGNKNTLDPYHINNIYGDTANRLKAMGSLQLTF